MKARINAFIIVFFTIQLLLPIRGFVYDRYDTRGRFSWNMYAQVHRVRAIYQFEGSDGQRRRINYKQYFNNPARATLVHHRDVLPIFLEFMCGELKREDPGGRLFGQVTTKVNDDPGTELLRTGIDVCTAPNYGVLGR